MIWETTVYRREELYEAVWSEPMQRLACKYGISDVALGKICRKLKVPVPGRGYWAQKAAGQKLSRPRLPKLPAGHDSQYRKSRWTDSQTTARMSAAAKEQIAREKTEDHQILVSEQLTDPHPLVQLSMPLLQNARDEQDRLLSKHRCLDIAVSSETLDRALRIMDALLKACESRGFSPVITKPGAECDASLADYPAHKGRSVTAVRIGNFMAALSLSEGFDRVELPGSQSKYPTMGFSRLLQKPPQPEYERRPNGKLTLRIHSQHAYGSRLSWTDGNVQRVEHCLNQFIATLISAAERERLAQLAAEENARREAEERRRREAEEQRQQNEARLVYDLNSRVSDWVQARTIRQFVAAVRAEREQASADTNPQSELGQWIGWALHYADALEVGATSNVLCLREMPRDNRWQDRFYNS